LENPAIQGINKEPPHATFISFDTRENALINDKSKSEYLISLNLGAQEVVLDMSTAGDFASRVIKGLTFSTSGLMYIATDAPNPILLYNPDDGSLDYLYKEILRPYCKAFCWGAGNYIYMINGDATAGEEWKVYKVNVGTTGIQ
jgi:hypothetical protein